MQASTAADHATRVCGVIVTYNPDLQALLRLIEAVRPQLDALVIVDNGKGQGLAPIATEHAGELIPLGDNFGIARAQNRGIDRAMALGATHVLLLDQDSIPAPDMVARLLAAERTLTARGLKVAAVGPSYLDDRQGEAAPFVYLDGFSLKRRGDGGADGIVEADFLIASGCLIARDSLDAIGPMIEEIFIDYVDIEWGLRARERGYHSYGVYGALMHHALGDSWVDFRGRRIPVHSPLRHYYHLRNAIWLARRPWISWRWRLVLAWRVVRQFLFFSFLVPDGAKHARMMARGIWHGLTGRMGKLGP